MGYSSRYPIGTKSIRSQADVEDYFNNFNANNSAAYTAYYAKDATFKFSSIPDMTLDQFLEWVDQVHVGVRETINLQRAAVDQTGTRVATEVLVQFRGNDNVEIDNFGGGWGPVWPGHGPLVKMYVWYYLNEEGQIKEFFEDAYLVKAASRPSANVIRSKDDLSRYLNAFSTNDFDTFPDFYTQDVTIILDGKHTLKGKDDVVGFFRKARQDFNEEVDLRSVTVDSNGAALTADVKFTAVVDIEEDILNFGPALRKGEGYSVHFVIFYELTPEGKISYVTAASSGTPKSIPKSGL